MINFVCIFLIILAVFLEIVLTTLIVQKIILLEKKVISCNEKLIIIGSAITQIGIKIKTSVKNLNKFVRILTNKNLIQTVRIVKMSIDIIQVIILIKSLNLSKGLKSINYGIIKKIIAAEVARRFIRRLIFNRF